MTERIEMGEIPERISLWHKTWFRSVLLIGTLLLFVPLVLIQQGLREERKKNVPPSLEFLYAHQMQITLGHEGLLADLYWIQSFRYVLQHMKGDRNYVYLAGMYNKITELDPHFINAYIYGSIFLTGAAGQDNPAEILLKRGYEKTGHWRVAVELGNFYLIRRKSMELAGDWYDVATRDSRCPPFYKHLAGAIRKDYGKDEIENYEISLESLLYRYEGFKKQKSEALMMAARKECLEVIETLLRMVENRGDKERKKRYLQLKRTLEKE